MSSLVEILYPLPDLRRTPLSLLSWWESRRLQYNAVVGAAGLFTLTYVSAASLIFWDQQLPSLQGVVMMVMAYGLAANVCYSLGWVLEMLARLVWGSQAPRMGPLLYREGLIFSVGLTLLPVLLVTLTSVLRILGIIMP